MSDEIKRLVAEFIKTNPVLKTDLGNVEITGVPLGQGGNGIVYPANFAGDAAIKILTEDVRGKPTTQYKRFRDEYCRLVKIPSHPSLMRLFHFDILVTEDFAVPYMIMERCSEGLNQLLKKHGKLQPEMLTKMLLQVGSALGHLHTHGIIHRDVKPENILVRADGDFVLGDFGIAWFDPDIHEREKLTKKGDKVANYQFSPPQQLDSSNTPEPNFDLFALGQVAYFSVAGEVIRGTHHKPLAKFDEAYRRFDALIDSMTRQSTEERFQSASDVLTKLQMADSEESNDNQILHSIQEFEFRLRRALPGQTGVIHVESTSVIERILNSISEACEEYSLWWTRGYSNMPTSKISSEDNGIWVIDGIEGRVANLWVGRYSTSADHCYILLKMEPMHPFDVYAGDHEYEEAGLFKGKYITRSEYDDGYAIIDEEPVALNGEAEVRIRYMKPHYMFLASKFNSILVATRLDSKADDLVDDLITRIETKNSVDTNDLEKLRKLPKHPVSLQWS